MTTPAGEGSHRDDVDRPHLGAESLVFERRRSRILDHVSVGFRRASVSALVGPSGAGKTTLLRCLNRLEEPTAGTVLFDGTDVRELDPRDLRRRVGMVFQTPVLFDGDVRGNLIYGLDGSEEDGLAGSLEAVHLSPDFLDRDTARLSVGEAQRVTIARALIRGPEVLLLDEPTSALDRDAASCIEHLVRTLSDERGLTVVLVTHDLAQAERVADVAVLVVSGRVALVGTPAEVQAGWR
ncbi:MAG: ATP-binding cassette domain-containing protein, partial [Actinobacteria bacterium]|nr:ATP-binding cassette domain-containing protein [Actinomycetota bacterium]